MTTDIDSNEANWAELAGEYVVGTLDVDLRARFEIAMVDNKPLQHLVGEWQNKLQPLADTVPEMTPRASLANDIMAAIAGEPQPGSVNVRHNTGEWISLFEGVSKKILYVNDSEGAESYLLKLEPGSVCPSHSHTKTEECYVLEGEMIIGEARFGAGDFHAAPPNIPHLPITSEIGAILLVRGEI